MRVFYPSSLLDFINSGAPCRRAQLLTLSLQSGLTIRLAEWDVDVTCDLGTFDHTGPSFKRANVNQKKGLDVDSMALYLYPKPTDTVAGTSWGNLFRNGGLDYAMVSIDVAVFDTAYPPGFLGYYNWFTGIVSEIPNIDALSAEITVKDAMTRLDIMMPRNVVQPGCLNTLFDVACKLKRESFVTHATVVAPSSDGSAFSTDLTSTPDPTYFNEGRLVVRSGRNANAVRKIKVFSLPNVYLFAPLYYPLQPDDLVDLYPGCDKLKETCVGRFGNGDNFRGMRWVPIPETVL